MLGLVHSVCSKAVGSSGIQARRAIARSKPCKPSQFVNKYNSSAKCQEKFAPGSRQLWKAFTSFVNHGSGPVDYKTPERILTVDDLEVNREAATLNARLRYLVATAAPYEEARKLAIEAQENGVGLDMHSYILLSTLYKPEIPAAWDELSKHFNKQVQIFADTFVPDSDFIAHAFTHIKSPSDSELLSDTVKFITERRAKLDVISLEAMFNAFSAANEGSKFAQAFQKLHKDYLIDTPTFDAFIQLHPNLSP